MGLAHQVGNKVTLSYRHRNSAASRNATRSASDSMKSARSKSCQLESDRVQEQSVLIESRRAERDSERFCGIFAGGTPPNDFLKKVGVALAARDMTKDASDEAKQAAAEKTSPSQRASGAPAHAKEALVEARLGFPRGTEKVAYKMDEAREILRQRHPDRGRGDSAIHAAVR